MLEDVNDADIDDTLYEAEDLAMSRGTGQYNKTLVLFSSDDSVGGSVDSASWQHLGSRSHVHQTSKQKYLDHYDDIEKLSGLTRSLTQQTHSPQRHAIGDVYAELQAISAKLKEEYKILQEREIIVKEKERVINASHANIKKIAEEEVNQRWSILEEQHRIEVQKMEQILREKARESKRLKDNFDTLKNVNDSIRKELEQLKGDHDKLEKHHTSLQARLTNLQKKQEFSSRQALELPLAIDLSRTKKETKENKDPKMYGIKSALRPSSNAYDVLAVLLDWISEVHMRHCSSTADKKSTQLQMSTCMSAMSSDHTLDRCFKVLPPLVDILRDFPTSSTKIFLPCLQFIYWSILHLDGLQGQQKTSLSSTMRRLGEELYRPKVLRFSDGDDRVAMVTSPSRKEKIKEGVFFRSSSLHVRFLSSLIILKTLSQVDLVAHVFDVLRNDLKEQPTKELYTHYKATAIILNYFKPNNKALLNSAVDVFLQMSTESITLQTFLESCSTEVWFRSCAIVLRTPNIDQKLIEKLSIILQKLSRMRTNKRYFEVYSISSMIQEILRNSGNGESAFMALNLKSVLHNLSNKESQTT